MAAISTGAGTCRKSGSKPPATATGHSTSAVTSSSSASSSTARPPSAAAAAVTHLRHLRAAGGEVGDHARGFEPRFVMVGMVDDQRLRMMKTVAVAEVAGRKTKTLEADHLRAVQRQQPVHRAHELAVLAIAPAHAPVDRQRLERRVEQARQGRGQRLAGLGVAMHQPGALVGFERRERAHLDAAGLREAEQGARRLAVGVEGGLQRRAAALDLARRRLIAHVGHAHGQPARTGEHPARRAGVGEPGFDQAAEQVLAKRQRQRLQGPRRQLLGADFDQQRGHQAASPAGAA